MNEKEKLEAEKLQSEIDKNKAEQAEIEKRTQEIEKRLSQKKIFGIPIYQTLVGGVIAGAFIITFSWRFLTPVLNKDAEIAKRTAELLNIENKLERARLDSLNTQLTAQKSQLETQVRLITARLDSTQKNQQEKLRLVNNELNKERSRSELDNKTISQLTAQVSTLKDDIKNTQNEKEQIRKIAASPYLSDEQVTSMLVENGFFDRFKNPNDGIKHQYEPQTLNGEKVVIDHTTGLTWQQSGSNGISLN